MIMSWNTFMWHKIWLIIEMHWLWAGRCVDSLLSYRTSSMEIPTIHVHATYLCKYTLIKSTKTFSFKFSRYSMISGIDSLLDGTEGLNATANSSNIKTALPMTSMVAYQSIPINVRININMSLHFMCSLECYCLMPWQVAAIHIAIIINKQLFCHNWIYIQWPVSNSDLFHKGSIYNCHMRLISSSKSTWDKLSELAIKQVEWTLMFLKYPWSDSPRIDFLKCLH